MLLDSVLTEDVVLERVDEYSLYAHYIGKELEVGKAYNSPLRTDDIPSFALFHAGSTILFKDHGLGQSGNVFKFIGLLYDEDMDAVLNRVNKDFDLELEGGEDYTKPATVPKKVEYVKTKKELLAIRISSKPYTKEFLQYWARYGISVKTLRLYDVSQVNVVHYMYKTTVKYYVPKTLCIAYRIYSEYKLYEPFNKSGKFRTNFKENYIEGYLQLTRFDFCIITKATKEIMFFREHYDWDSVAGKSENTMIKRHMMLKLLKRYKVIYIWLDYDVPGQRAQKKYLKMYPFLVPIYLRAKQKDVTDYYEAANNKQAALDNIKCLIPIT